MARLIHLNGPPGVGKSTLAAALVNRRPLALNLDIDELRVRLGGWQEREESKQIARDLGIRLAEWHLQSDHDVVLPQLLLRADVVEHIERVALAAGASFSELILMAPLQTCIERSAATRVANHPRNEFPDDELARRIEYSRNALLDLAATQPDTRLVDVDGDIEDALRRIGTALEDAEPAP